MYEVGEWFVYLMNLAILAVLGVIVLIAILRKRGQYQKEAQLCVQAEVWQPTGWAEYHTVKCSMNAVTVDIGGFTYRLNPDKKRWGMHPRLPFIGLRSLQVPIRKETWYKDKPEPITDPKTNLSPLTAAELKAIQREGRATMAARHSQQLEAANKQVIEAIANQANKAYVYLGLGIIGIGVVVMVVRLFLMGG